MAHIFRRVAVAVAAGAAVAALVVSVEPAANAAPCPHSPAVVHATCP
jgi:hypothetical protein